MPLLPVNAEGDTLRFDRGALARAIDALPAGAPVVAMIHGFRFAPGAGRHCPHGHILSMAPRRDLPRAVSWPRHLRLGGPAGLGLAFGWNARGTLWQATARSAPSAAALARLISEVRAVDPSRSVDVFAHSLGARVALEALPQVPEGAVGEVILLTPADFRDHAERAIASPAGRAARIVSITSGSNRMFDFCMETLLSARLHASLGQGLCKPPANWLDLRIDDAATEAALLRLGYPLRPGQPRICHWQAYLRPGLFALYRALLQRRLSHCRLRAALLQHGSPADARLLPLPVAHNPA